MATSEHIKRGNTDERRARLAARDRADLARIEAARAEGWGFEKEWELAKNRVAAWEALGV